MAEPMFSKAGKGYNREEVDAYLLDLNRSYSEKEASLQDEIKKLTASLADSERRYQQAEASFKAKEEELTSAYKAKEEECSSMMATIGQRIMLADDRAEKIVSEANEKADSIVENANQQADEVCREALLDAQKQADAILEATKAHCGSFEKAVEDIKRMLLNVQNEVDATEKLMNQSLLSARNAFPIVEAPEQPAQEESVSFSEE